MMGLATRLSGARTKHFRIVKGSYVPRLRSFDLWRDPRPDKSVASSTVSSESLPICSEPLFEPRGGQRRGNSCTSDLW